MKKIFFTPGPTQLYPSVPKHVHDAVENDICSISHRGRDFENIFLNASDALKHLLNIPKDFHIFFLSSATEAMERIIQNLVELHSFHFVNGAFSKRFFSIAQDLKKDTEKIEAGFGKGFDFASLKIPKKTELICFTQNETSTGTNVVMEDIYKIKRKNTDKLAAADIVSSVPYVNVDYSLVDCAFFSVQKGFGLPAGLGVLIANEKCIEKAKYLQDNNYNIGSYHNFLSLLKNAEKNQTLETPNILNIYILGKVCEELNKAGIEKIRKDTEKKAEMIYNFFDDHSLYSPFVENREIRSKTIIVINTPNGSQELIKKLSEKGFVVGSGYKEYKDKQIRIANFPMHKSEDIERMLKLI